MFLVNGYSGKIRPKNYQGILYNEDESLNLGKYPTLSWSSDGFTNWLTQNAINIAVGTIGSVAGGALSVAGGLNAKNAKSGAISATGGIVSSATSIAGTIGSIVQASMIPNTAEGNANAGDISFSENLNRFKVLHMRPKEEYLKIIDDYFSRFRISNKQSKNS